MLLLLLDQHLVAPTVRRNERGVLVLRKTKLKRASFVQQSDEGQKDLHAVKKKRSPTRTEHFTQNAPDLMLILLLMDRDGSLMCVKVHGTTCCRTNSRDDARITDARMVLL